MKKIKAYLKKLGVEGVLFYLLLLATTVIIPVASYIVMINIAKQ